MKIEPKNVRKILDRNILADGFEPIIDLNKSHGSYLVDQRNGDEYLDMFSMYASGAVGYNHPYILKHKDILGDIAVNKTTLSDIYNVYYADFIETFSKYAMPDYLSKVFFIDGGSLAVENALKAAFDWKKRKNLKSGFKQEGDKVIYFNQSFHGRSGYTLTLTNTSDPRKTMYFPKFPWFKVDNPKLSFPINNDILADVAGKEKKVINHINNIISENPNDVAAIIIEPIQGEGGDNHFRNDFMVKIREICDNNDIIFILDEVQTGIGITGKMWAHEHFSVKPDIISFGKKTQVCGMMASNRIYEFDKNVFKESSRINSTFGGNLVDMYRFKLILEIMCNENLFSNVQEMGHHLLEQINRLADQFPGYVTNPRGQGLFCAFDLPSTIERDKMIAELLDRKLIILGSGDNSIRFRPHLNVAKQDIDIAIEKITDVIQLMLN
ncbi:MAG: L-lysine 6-transaminase [Candidatus Marinimicrobia bacterium]|nr:L-lysine 6-transaminase [Candidatus Neomarinimicrobiota bacterium]|tara:strand:- start:41123 stop:42439 length:1317 start_codon:yes stop_codon:yes gene_type:complete